MMLGIDTSIIEKNTTEMWNVLLRVEEKLDRFLGTFNTPEVTELAVYNPVWQYKTLWFEMTPGLQDELNNLGAAGWELVSLTHSATQVFTVFKRAAEELDEDAVASG